MPCWEIRRCEVDLKAADIGILFKGLEADPALTQVRQYGDVITGYYKGLKFTIEKGKLSARYDQQTTIDIGNAVNRAYSKEIVRKAADKYGWVAEGKSEDGLSMKLKGRG